MQFVFKRLYELMIYSSKCLPLAKCFLPKLYTKYRPLAGAEDWNGLSQMGTWLWSAGSWEVRQLSTGEYQGPQARVIWEIQITDLKKLIGRPIFTKFNSPWMTGYKPTRTPLCVERLQHSQLFFKSFFLTPLGLSPQQTHTAKTPNFFKNNLFVSDHKVQ